MACYHPIIGYRSKELNSNGKRNLVFTPSQALEPDNPLNIACGQCIGCRLERSRQWAVRCIHEAQMHKRNCFITLTYAPEHLPKDGSLELQDLQKFFKRLRKANNGQKIRYFSCGEYGDENSRPHYHACVFGFDFRDKQKLFSRDGQIYYESQELQKLWPYGRHIIGDVTFESAAYVARYVMKKVTGEKATLHYNKVNMETGEVLLERRPEFTTMSRRPGIGRTWFDKYQDDVFPWDSVVVKGKETKPPKYYLNRYEVVDPFGFDDVKERRNEERIMLQKDNTRERMIVKEELKKQYLKDLKRKYENET